MRQILWPTAILASLAGCSLMTGPKPAMGTAVSGEQFERKIAGQVFSFRLPDGVQTETQFQPGGTVVYRGAAFDGVGRWRPWEQGYCAYYPQIGGGPAADDGYRCYEVRAADGYYALFRPDGVYVGALVPLG
jgi:hypothetical protein